MQCRLAGGIGNGCHASSDQDDCRRWAGPGPAAQKIIAPWIAKFEVLAHGTEIPPSVAPMDRRRWIFQHGEPSPDAVVWLAAHTGSPGTAMWRRSHGLELRLQPVDRNQEDAISATGDVMTFQIGALAAQILLLGCVDLELGPETPAEIRTVQIWPLSKSHAVWPPTYSSLAELNEWATSWISAAPPL